MILHFNRRVLIQELYVAYCSLHTHNYLIFFECLFVFLFLNTAGAANILYEVVG
jgi:hypothetical protein